MNESVSSKSLGGAEKEEANKRQRAAVEAALAEGPARSTGSVTLGGKAMAYRVDAGFVPVRSALHGETLGEPDAALFTTAYQLEGEGASNRAVCFDFNGGPG